MHPLWRGGLVRRVMEVLTLGLTACLMYLVWSLNYSTKYLYNDNGSQNAIYYPKVGFAELQGADCMAAFSRRVKNEDFIQNVERKTTEQIKNDTTDCSKFIEDYGFNRYPPATEEEKHFPLAFTILFHKDLDQVLYLLRAVYRPHNVYCLSVDLKTNYTFMETVKGVADCVPNIIMASTMERIVYAGFERLKADINCMVDLYQHPVQWKYVINMVGQQFPLRTNLEIVRILKLYNGTSEVEVLPRSKRQDYRFIYKHVYRYKENQSTPVIRLTSKRNPPPPHAIEIRKGSVFGSFSRQFIDFVIHEPIVKDFLDWCENVYSPDEYFWASLQFGKDLNVPGGYRGLPPLQSFITAYASWPGQNRCATKRVRLICIFSTEDLFTLDRKFHLFANKFYITHHPAALHCLDERIYNYTVHRVVRDISYYEDQVALGSQIHFS